MPASIRALTCVLLFGSLNAAFAAEPTTLRLDRGHAEIIRYSEAPGVVIIGDARIAAANITASGVLVLTAMASGATNVIVLDADGGDIDRFVLAVPAHGEAVSVRRAMARETMICDPACRSPEDIARRAAEPADQPQLQEEPEERTVDNAEVASAAN